MTLNNNLFPAFQTETNGTPVKTVSQPFPIFLIGFILNCKRKYKLWKVINRNLFCFSPSLQIRTKRNAFKLNICVHVSTSVIIFVASVLSPVNRLLPSPPPPRPIIKIELQIKTLTFSPFPVNHERSRQSGKHFASGSNIFSPLPRYLYFRMALSPSHQEEAIRSPRFPFSNQRFTFCTIFDGFPIVSMGFRVVKFGHRNVCIHNFRGLLLYRERERAS